jgi:pimeloyl-ACP methyl ester carboxylesterase
MSEERGGAYAEVNGLNFYYEVHGEGEPLILPLLAEGRQVIGVDLQAHGRTADIDRPMTYEATMADDVAALIEHLSVGEANVMGYSLGGGVALQTAIRHPEAAEPMKEAPMYLLYAGVAPRPEDWPVLLARLGELLRQDYDWSEDVAALEMPVMIVVGDADSIPPVHAAEFFGLLGGGERDAGWDGSGMPESRLAILPGTTHYDIFYSPALVSAVAPFLDAPAAGVG